MAMVSDAYSQEGATPGAFAVPGIPETCTILRGRCPHCGGNVKAEDGDICCMWCTRSLSVGEDGFVASSHRPPVIRKVGGVVKLNAQSTYHDEGITNRAARVLSEIPMAPDHVGVSAIGRALNMSNPDVREAIESLMSIGLVEEVVYGDGDRWIGYCLAGG